MNSGTAQLSSLVRGAGLLPIRFNELELDLMQLSVITATYHRPAFLAHCLHQFQTQVLDGITCEHIVVSDGPDADARFLAHRWKARYFETEVQQGHAGAFAKDLGITQAQGDYVCFWDDDNLYFPQALMTLHAAAHGKDVGIVRAKHRLRRQVGMVPLPRSWNGKFKFGDIDTMCLSVRNEFARLEKWGDADASPGTDFRWLRKLESHSPIIQYVPTIIGIHL